MDWMRELYSEVVLDYARNDKYKGRIEGALQERDRNESCGDEVNLFVKYENGKVVDARYEGVGCIVSQASAAMLVKIIKGKTKEEIKEIMDNVKKMMKGEPFNEDVLGDLVVFSGISGIPQRSKCFYLAWSVLERIYAKIERGDRS